MFFLANLFKSAFDIWLENASYEELADDHEKRRQAWLKEGAETKRQSYEELIAKW